MLDQLPLAYSLLTPEVSRRCASLTLLWSLRDFGKTGHRGIIRLYWPKEAKLLCK